MRNKTFRIQEAKSSNGENIHITYCDGELFHVGIPGEVDEKLNGTVLFDDTVVEDYQFDPDVSYFPSVFKKGCDWLHEHGFGFFKPSE